MSKPKPAPPEHMALAWHILLEKKRYGGTDFSASLSKAFGEITKKYNQDNEQHVDVRNQVEELRKELGLE